jgi:hypothetical protein
MIPDLINLLQIFVDNSAAQPPVNRRLESGDGLVPTERCLTPQLQQLHVIDVNSWRQSNVERWSEFIDIISRLKNLELLAFHGIDLVPIPQRLTTETSPNIRSLPLLTTLETSLPVKGQVRNYGVLKSPVPIAAFSHAFQKCMKLPSLSRLIIRDLEYTKFGDDLLDFLAGFGATLLYLHLEISESPQQIGLPARCLDPIEMPNLRHLEISFLYQTPILKTIRATNLQLITVNSVHRIFRSMLLREPRVPNTQLTQNDLLGYYSLSDLFSCIHSALMAGGEDEGGSGNDQLNISIARLSKPFIPIQ